MSYEWVNLLLFTLSLGCLTPILGTYIANVFTGRAVYAQRALGWLEKVSYRMAGVDAQEEMTWINYAKALLLFNVLGFCFLFFLQLVQPYLPLNPQHFGAPSWQLAYNTALSFTTNTDWQSYAGETTLSYLTQMVGLTSQNFLSAATGMAALLTLTRGLTRKSMDSVGNFWVDVVRMLVYLLLPLSLILAIFLVSEGVVQTFSPYVEVTTLEHGTQTIPLGPVASQVAIKQLGTNGGGFFNANSAHPFENPTPASNFFEMLALLLIPAASVYAYGVMIGSRKHSGLLFCAMLLLWGGGLLTAFVSENMHNAVIDTAPLWEGKETRFGISDSLLWSMSTTATANGSINAMLSSLSPLAGGVALFNMMLGELIFGGIGVGLCSMIMFIFLTVFLSGLMVGRTPEYLGKKIEMREMQWVVMAVLMPGVMILIGSGISCVLPVGVSGLGNQGPHGLSEILYAFTSCVENNGSSFAGLNTNNNYYNLALGTMMLFGRVAIILPSLAIAGLLAKKKSIPFSAGTFSTHSILFFILLISVILIVGGLTFFPALSLGPIVEHLLMLKGESF